jgi:hypothetical protein
LPLKHVKANRTGPDGGDPFTSPALAYFCLKTPSASSDLLRFACHNYTSLDKARASKPGEIRM